MVFAALGDRPRLDLLAKLAEGQPRSIAELAAGTKVTRQAITRHLRVLESAGLVSGTRSGREVRFRFEAGPMNEAKAFIDRMSAQWDQALSRLKAFAVGGEKSGDGAVARADFYDGAGGGVAEGFGDAAAGGLIDEKVLTELGFLGHSI